MRSLRNNKGLTLVEVLLSISILAIVIVPIMNFYAQSFKTNHKNEIQLNLHTQAITAFEQIKNAVAEGRNDNINFGNKQFDINANPCKQISPLSKTVSLDLSGVNYQFQATIAIEHFSTEEIINEIKKNIGTVSKSPENLFKIDMILTPIDNDLQTENFSVIKLSPNGCGFYE